MRRLVWLLEGGTPDDRYPITPYFRDYLLASRFGYTHEQIQAQPAVWLDWMIEIDGKVREIENKARTV